MQAGPSCWLALILVLALAGAISTSVSLASRNFDPSSYRNIHEAINGHPELKQFAKLCEADGVRDVIRMNAIQLTVFAPIDRSLSDLLSRPSARPTINLIDLAKHHIAQGFITADDSSTKLPLKFSTFSLLSPLFLNKITHTGNGAPSQFVNNAKILATHLIPIANATDADQYQTLHIIDQPLEYAFINKVTELTGGNGQRRNKNVKLPLGLDDLQTGAVHEFYERFAHLQTGNPQADLLHARVFKGTASEVRQDAERISYPPRALDIERLASKFRSLTELRGKLYQLDENSPMATYFLPVDSQDLDKLLNEPANLQKLALEAHIIPDEVLFTRVMSLGKQHASLASGRQGSHRVTLSLAKSLPSELSHPQVGQSDVSSDSLLSRRLLTAPLLLQASTSSAGSDDDGSSSLRAGLTSSEILVANIPLRNGVLHLIKRPILPTDTKLLDYLNDNDNQLSDVVQSVGSQSSDPVDRLRQLSQPTLDELLAAAQPVVKVNRFRELLARERQLLARLSSDGSAANRTILAPSDEAFARLRYDLRALVQNDDSLIPRHWDASYRQDLLERLVKRHVVTGQSLASEQVASNPSMQLLTENGRALRFKVTSGGSSIYVDCDDTQAKLVQRDLVATNGMLHIIDRVLGEELETIDSLLRSMLLRNQNSLDNELGQQEQASSGVASFEHQLYQLVESNLRQEMISSPAQTNTVNNNQLQNAIDSGDQQQQVAAASHEQQIISRSIGQFLDELAGRQQLHHLTNSVNISYQLARLTSLVEGLDDFNDRFKSVDRQFTYFVPNDLAWIKLQQAQPELYKPLMYILEHQSAGQPQHAQLTSGEQLATSSNLASNKQTPRSSPESSHRLRQILERHLIVNRRVAKRELNNLDSLQTMSATLRLVEPSGQQHHADPLTVDGSSGQQASGSYAAALHSIGHQAPPVAANKLKSIRLDSTNANIVQVGEASNGVVYVIDSVLILPQDSDYIVQSSASPAISSSVSSLLGAHNSAILDFIQGFLVPASLNTSATSILALIGTLTLAIALLLIVTLVLIVRRRRQTKLNRHQQLESGLTSSSSANSGSTSTTKSL